MCPHCHKAHPFTAAGFVSQCSAVASIEFTAGGVKVTFGKSDVRPQPRVIKPRVVRQVATQRVVRQVS